MSWKFWKRSKEVIKDVEFSIETESPVIPMSTLFRWYCYDMDITNPNKIAAQLGLSGLSEDVEEMEKEASAKRLDLIVPILPFLQSLAQINSIVVTEFQHENIKSKMHLSDEEADDVLETTREILGQVSMSALIAAFSAALSLGVVLPSGVVAKEVDNGKF